MKNKEKDNVEKLHPYGFKGLIEVYGGWAFLKKPSFYLSFIFSISVFVFSLISDSSEKELFDLIKDVVETGISLDGGLIGLTLAGLTLIVTFGSEKLLKRMVKLEVEKSFEEKRLPTFSGYQTAVSKFSFAVFVQVLTLVVLFIYKLTLGFSFSFKWNILNGIFNSFYLSLAVFLVFFSLLLVVQMTLNIFTISQMNHSVYFKESVDEVLESAKKSDEPTK